MKIHEVMKTTGLSKKAINYYEEKGLIEVHKSDNGYREYDEATISRLWQLKVLRKLDFSSADIELMMQGKHEEVFQSHFDTIDKRIAQCNTQKAYIQALYEQLETKDVALFQQMDEAIEEEFQLQNSVKVDIRKKRREAVPLSQHLVIFALSFAMIVQTEYLFLNVIGFIMLLYGCINASLSYGPSTPMDLAILQCKDHMTKFFKRR